MPTKGHAHPLRSAHGNALGLGLVLLNIWLERGESQSDIGLSEHELTREVNAD